MITITELVIVFLDFSLALSERNIISVRLSLGHPGGIHVLFLLEPDGVDRAEARQSEGSCKV